MRHGFTTGEPMTLDEIGREFGVTRERIRQIEVKAIKRLRTRFGVVQHVVVEESVPHQEASA